MAPSALLRRDTARMGPVIDAPHPWREDGARAKATEVVDAQLAGIASIVRFRRGEFVCREGEPAVAMFSLVVFSMVVASVLLTGTLRAYSDPDVWPADMTSASTTCRMGRPTFAASWQAPLVSAPTTSRPSIARPSSACAPPASTRRS